MENLCAFGVAVCSGVGMWALGTTPTYAPCMPCLLLQRTLFKGRAESTTHSDFISQWASCIVQLILWQPFEAHHHTFTVFLQALRAYDASCAIPQSTGAPQWKKQKKSKHEDLVPEMVTHLEAMETQGWTIAYTAGPLIPSVGGVWWGGSEGISPP